VWLHFKSLALRTNFNLGKRLFHGVQDMFNIIPISLEQGLAYALAALGIAFAFRILSSRI
jgi:hypothetical protein